MNTLTIIAVLVIGCVAIGYLQSLLRLRGVSSQILKANGNLASVSKVFEGIDNSYNNTINVDINGTNKTLHHADEYYNISEIARVKHINLKHVYSAPGVLSGLGVLGTFVGLTVSVSTFDSTDSLAIMTSIKTLLGGMGTAFITSLVGMALSAI